MNKLVYVYLFVYTHISYVFIHVCVYNSIVFAALSLINLFLGSEVFGYGLCSLNWQHQLCKNPRPNPDIKTLFTDHACSPQNGARAPTPVTLPVAAIAKPSTYVPLGVHGVRI